MTKFMENLAIHFISLKLLFIIVFGQIEKNEVALLDLIRNISIDNELVSTESADVSTSGDRRKFNLRSKQHGKINKRNQQELLVRLGKVRFDDVTTTDDSNETSIPHLRVAEAVEELKNELKKKDFLDVESLKKNFQTVFSFLKDKYYSLFKFENKEDRAEDDLTSMTEKLKISNVKVMDRHQWNAQKPTGTLNRLELPVSNIIIAHTGTRSCNSEDDCAKFTSNIQKFDMRSRGWDDIGYNFLIGGDGTVYEGRGFDHVGTHTKGHDQDSLGIALIGTFTIEKPTEQQLDTLRSLLQYGVENDKISKNYKLYPHNAFTETASPGFHLLKRLEKMDSYTKNKPFKEVDIERGKGSMNIVERDEWLAQPPMKKMSKISIPTDGVVIHHTETDTCTSEPKCIKEVRNLQMKHIEAKGWDDIGYNFLVGGDGRIYEGLGWNYIGGKAQRHKEYYAFALLGNFDKEKPKDFQMDALKELIGYGVKRNKIRKEYKLYPYSFFKKTSSPGKRVIEVISRWSKYVHKKASKHDRAKNSYVQRDEWNATMPLRSLETLKLPAEEVYIHQTDTASCPDFNTCVAFVKELQNSHMINGSQDIKFNFLIGGDGTVFEGLGWNFVGNHTKKQNEHSIGIALIGTFDTEANLTPSTSQVDACHELMTQGVEEKKLKENYILHFKVR